MTRMFRKVAVILAVTCWASLPATAQEQPLDSAEGEDEERSYTAEVIIFSYEQNVAVGSEVFPPDKPVDDIRFDTPDAVEEEIPQEPVEPDTGERTLEIVLLDEDEFSMMDIASRLRRLDAYEPVMHFGWTQVTRPEEETLPIALHVFGRPPTDLDGSLTLYLSRFLHLIVDLKMKQPGGVTDEPEFGQDGFEAPVYYRISEDRIFKSGDIRYFDHPKFGVVAKITRVEAEDEEIPAP